MWSKWGRNGRLSCEEILIFCVTRCRSPAFNHLSSSLALSQALAVFLTNNGGPLPTVKHKCFSYSLIKFHSYRPLTVLFCGFQESDVKSGRIRSGLIVLKFAVRDFCRQYGRLMDRCSITFPTTCRLQSFMLQIFAARWSTFLTSFCECLISFHFLLVLIVKKALGHYRFFFLIKFDLLFLCYLKDKHVLSLFYCSDMLKTIRPSLFYCSSSLYPPTFTFLDSIVLVLLFGLYSFLFGMLLSKQIIKRHVYPHDICIQNILWITR